MGSLPWSLGLARVGLWVAGAVSMLASFMNPRMASDPANFAAFDLAKTLEYFFADVALFSHCRFPPWCTRRLPQPKYP